MTNFAQAFGNKFNQNAIRTRTFELNGHTFKVKVPLTHETEEMYEKVKQVDEEKAQKYYEKMSKEFNDNKEEYLKQGDIEFTDDDIINWFAVMSP